MTRDVLLKKVGELDPVLRDIFNEADCFVKCCEDTGSDDFQIAARVYDAFVEVLGKRWMAK